MPDYVPSTCPTCGGDGVLNGKLCPTCYGSGSLPVTGSSGLVVQMLVERMDDFIDRANDILDKCNDILEAINAP